jgi:hypothetical protein
VREELAGIEAAIVAGDVHPYAGEIRDQAGGIRVPEGEVLPDADVRSMNWLVEGMTGSLG